MVAAGIRCASSALVWHSVIVGILADSQCYVSKISKPIVIAVQDFAIKSLDEEININRVDDTVLIDVSNGTIIIWIRLPLCDACSKCEEIQDVDNVVSIEIEFSTTERIEELDEFGLIDRGKSRESSCATSTFAEWSMCCDRSGHTSGERSASCRPIVQHWIASSDTPKCGRSHFCFACIAVADSVSKQTHVVQKKVAVWPNGLATNRIFERGSTRCCELRNVTFCTANLSKEQFAIHSRLWRLRWWCEIALKIGNTVDEAKAIGVHNILWICNVVADV